MNDDNARPIGSSTRGCQSEDGRPRFLNESVAIPSSDGLIIDGTERLQIMRGEAARTLLPKLIPLTDGHLTADELEAALPEFPPQSIREALALLSSSGLVEDVFKDHPTANGQTLAFFRRFLSVTRRNTSGLEAWTRLAGAEIVVIGPGLASEFATGLQTVLISTGAGSVSVLEKNSFDWGPQPWTNGRSPDLVVVVSFGPEELSWLSRFDTWCASHQIVWFRAVIDKSEGYADIGPVFQTGAACYVCFHKVHSRESDSQGSSETPCSPADVDLWVGIIATEIIYSLTGIGPVVSGRGFRRYDLQSWEAKDLGCPRIPGCARCRPRRYPVAESGGSRSAILTLDPALAYEDCVGILSRAVHDPRSYEESVRTGRLLSRHTKTLPICRQYALPVDHTTLGVSVRDAFASDITPLDMPLTIGQVSMMLQMSAGLRNAQDGQTVRRWAATAGNLGSVELYVVARKVTGLPPGSYFYQPLEHSLAMLQWRSGQVSVDDFIRRATGSQYVDLPEALIIFTGAFHRVRRKYSAFGYRLINLDAGACASQLQAVAASLSLFSCIANVWADDFIEEQLHLEKQDEQCTACVVISRSELRLQAHASVQGDEDLLKDRQIGRPARDYRELTVHEILNSLHKESRTREGEMRLTRWAPPSSLNAENINISFCVALPAPREDGRSMGEVLETRQSTRIWSNDSVASVELSGMLRSAHDCDIRDWPDESANRNYLGFLVLAVDVEGLDKACYTYDPRRHALVLHGPLPSMDGRIGLVVQSELASAPLQVWVLGDLAVATARHGAWGHRQSLLRAGAAANRLSLTALSYGLAGTIAAGLVSGAAALHLDLDGFRSLALCMVAVGRNKRH